MALTAKAIQPNKDMQQRLNMVIREPYFKTMDKQNKTSMWVYRYWLKEKKEAIVKFLLSVNWNSERQEKEAVSLLETWAPIELEQALPLLSAFFCVNDIYTKFRELASLTENIKRRF